MGVTGLGTMDILSTPGYASIYLKYPLQIEELIHELNKSVADFKFTWREKEGSHYSMKVADVLWGCRDNKMRRFEIGITDYEATKTSVVEWAADICTCLPRHLADLCPASNTSAKKYCCACATTSSKKIW